MSILRIDRPPSQWSITGDGDEVAREKSATELALYRISMSEWEGRRKLLHSANINDRGKSGSRDIRRHFLIREIPARSSQST